MSLIKWLGIMAIERLGWLGAAGAVLLAISAVEYTARILALQQELRIAQSEATPARSTARGPGSQRQELASFKAFFAGAPVEQRLGEIHESGKAIGLTFKRIEYRILEERRSGLMQYQIVMPVKSSYPRIRQFTSLVLAKVRPMSLDHIQFQRKNISDGTVEAELRFTLFLNDPA